MRQVALLPNIFTTGNMVCGISAILCSLGGTAEDLKRACWLVMLAILLDGLDGMIAVLTRTCTKFGIQYDSLADLVSFGVAPAMLMIANYRLTEGATARPTREFWAMSVVLVVCVALRLARYNVQAYTSEKKTFQGLPCPSPGGFIALLILSFHEYDYSLPPKILMLIVIALGILMVSSVPYPSLRKSDFFKTQPISALLLVVLGFALVVMEPVGAMLLLITGYILSGVVHRFLPAHLAEHLDRYSETSKRSV
jgi:CDP-diacylglycerol--serine O-phosphatidyltransferase